MNIVVLDENENDDIKNKKTELRNKANEILNYDICLLKGITKDGQRISSGSALYGLKKVFAAMAAGLDTSIILQLTETLCSVCADKYLSDELSCVAEIVKKYEQLDNGQHTTGGK